MEILFALVGVSLLCLVSGLVAYCTRNEQSTGENFLSPFEQYLKAT